MPRGRRGNGTAGFTPSLPAYCCCLGPVRHVPSRRLSHRTNACIDITVRSVRASTGGCPDSAGRCRVDTRTPRCPFGERQASLHRAQGPWPHTQGRLPSGRRLRRSRIDVAARPLLRSHRRRAGSRPGPAAGIPAGNYNQCSCAWRESRENVGSVSRRSLRAGRSGATGRVGRTRPGTRVCAARRGSAR